ERCGHCGTELTGDTSEYVSTLFDMPVSRARPADRITSNEEERIREGYELATYYRFAPRPDGRFLEERAVAVREGRELLELVHGPQATLWRINNGWRRLSDSQPGFVVDVETGYWARRSDAPEPDAERPAGGRWLRVRPYVRDTRNVLLLHPKKGGERPAPDMFLVSLAYALDRAIQVLYQVEPHEIAVELIGEGSSRRILLWEAAEGGVGVWSRLLDESGAVAAVARKALEILHFDPDTGVDLASREEDGCTRACYECLLNYTNQRDHRLLDRHAVRDFLMELARSETLRSGSERSYEEQYRWLLEQIDPRS